MGMRASGLVRGAKAVKRRGLLAGAALLGGGLAGLAGPDRAEATSGTNPEGNFVLGANAFTAGRTANTATTTQLNASGGGISGALQVNNSNGRSIVVTGSSTWIGVHGTSPNTIGVAGVSTLGVGVSGSSNSNIGVHGVSSSATGVQGESSGAGIGVRGLADAAGGIGVRGRGGTFGLLAEVNGGAGVALRA